MKYFMHCMKNYANFKGRARRSEYWYFVLFYFIIYILVAFISGLLSNISEMLSAIFILIFALGMLIPTIAVAVRRMHDVGKSGWFMLIPIYSLILAVTEGDKGPNEYGPDPKNPELETMDHIVV